METRRSKRAKEEDKMEMDTGRESGKKGGMKEGKKGVKEIKGGTRGKDLMRTLISETWSRTSVCVCMNA